MENRLKSLLTTSEKLVKLKTEVEEAFGVPALFYINPTLSHLGGYDHIRAQPTFVFHPDHINESNIAHEMIHALQKKSGFPIIIKDLVNDKRFTVIQELNSNLLHINLVEQMSNRGIDVKPYISSTITKLQNFIHNKSDVKKMRSIGIPRTHYDAIVLLRLKYEAVYIPESRKRKTYRLYKSRYPEAYDLFTELVNIIDTYNMHAPETTKEAFKKCLQLLQKEADYSMYIKLLND
ncbi:hypothetical protein [Sulfurimonas diazotrophicus]|uniref:IrrE N-terminal-like domain-containing protein n=1 Tax=Sulfurimonas diazotrophicus TaxID=3131939 RepID=A0ABZ3H7M1_9BACT